MKVDTSTVSRWTKGEHYPDITSLPVLSSILDVSIDYLLTGENYPSDLETKAYKKRSIIFKIIVGLYACGLFVLIGVSNAFIKLNETPVLSYGFIISAFLAIISASISMDFVSVPRLRKVALCLGVLFSIVFILLAILLCASRLA